jgi:quinol monooxygenase YgiN
VRRENLILFSFIIPRFPSSTALKDEILYEAYDSLEAAAAHKQTPHYLKWKETVAPWMAKPREGIPYRALAPHNPLS